MLVLTRQRDETIMIGDEIEITVVEIRGDRVRLGITAPTRIAVHRKEVYEAIKAENQRAGQISLGGGGGTDLSELPSPGPMKRPRTAGSIPAARLCVPELGINPPKSGQATPDVPSQTRVA